MSPALVTIVLFMCCLAVVADQTCPADTVCTTPECLRVATEMLEAIDNSVEPCDDFYQFSCGAWIKRQSLKLFSHRKKMTDTDQNLARIRDLLAEDPIDTDHSTVKKAKTLYRSCVYDQLGEQRQTFYEWIVKNFGHWPMTCANCDKRNFFLRDAMYTATLYGVHPLFSLSVKPYVYKDAFGNTTEELKIHIGKPELGFSFIEYEAFRKESTYIDFYVEHIHDIAVIFGIESSWVVRRDARTIVEMEMQLANLYKETNENGSEELVPVSLIILRFGMMVNWISIINKLARTADIDELNMSTDTVVVSDPNYLFKVFKYFTQQSRSSQADYIIWRVIDSLRSVAINKDRKLYDIILRHLIKTQTGNSFPDMGCALYVSKVFEYAVHRMLNKVYPPPGQQKKVHCLLQIVKEEFPLLLMDTGLIYEESWRDALKRVINVHNLLLYKDIFDSDKNLDDYYSDIRVEDSRFTLNVMSARRAAVVRNMRPLLEKYRTQYKPEPTELPQELVVRYDPHTTQAAYTSSLFQPPWFVEGVPTVINYAGMGFVYGQALMHGFISDHVQQYGTQQANTTTNDYVARINCFVEEYNKYFYTPGNRTVNGTLTKFNNIADIAGLQLAYNAFKRSSRLLDKQHSLPELPYSPSQLFFLRFAQNWCDVEDSKAANETLYSPYSPSKFRVNGAVSQLRDFSIAFNCPVGSDMRPTKICDL